MINVQTYCKDCVHKKVCRNGGQPELFRKKLSSLIYGTGPSDDYDWDTMSSHYGIKIDISCINFERVVPKRKSTDFNN